MTATLNANGTLIPFFKIGKNGTTLYQGITDPTTAYTIKDGDLWIDTSINSLKIWSTAGSGWTSPRLGNLSFSSNSIIAPGGQDLVLSVDATHVVSVSSGLSVTGTITGTSFTGNAATASSLQTARTLSFTGDATGSLSFDGSANASTALTLSTVNTTPVTNSLQKITVNGKGLVTATSAVTASDIETVLGYTPIATIAPTTVTTNFTATSSNGCILANGTLTVTLPDPTTNAGKVFVVKNISTGTVTINTTNTKNIDNSTSATITTQYTSITMISDGTAYWII